WIGCADRPRLGAGVPVVDGGVKLDAWVGRGPGGMADLLPEVASLERLDGAAAEPSRERPVAILLDGLEELVGHAHGVVRVLARDREIGLAVPVGVVGGKLDLLVALACVLDDAADVVVGHKVAPRLLDGAPQRGISRSVEAGLALRLAIDAGLHDGLEPLLANLGAGDEGGD